MTSASWLATSRPALFALTMAAGSALLLAAACGDESDEADSSDSRPEAPGDLTAYVECLQEQGIEVTPLTSGRPGGAGAPNDFPTARPTDLPSDFPTGRPGNGPGGPGGPGGRNGLQPEGVDDETWQAAREACGSLMPEFGGPPGAGDEEDGPAADTAYRNCLADRDVELSDVEENPQDPDVAEAIEACEALRPDSS